MQRLALARHQRGQVVHVHAARVRDGEQQLVTGQAQLPHALRVSRAVSAAAKERRPGAHRDVQPAAEAGREERLRVARRTARTLVSAAEAGWRRSKEAGRSRVGRRGDARSRGRLKRLGLAQELRHGQRADACGGASARCAAFRGCW